MTLFRKGWTKSDTLNRPAKPIWPQGHSQFVLGWVRGAVNYPDLMIGIWLLILYPGAREHHGASLHDTTRSSEP
jgi:hypothetical protein